MKYITNISSVFFFFIIIDKKIEIQEKSTSLNVCRLQVCLSSPFAWNPLCHSFGVHGNVCVVCVLNQKQAICLPWGDSLSL